MLKKSLFAVAVVALLAAMAPAGEIKIHNWPTGGYIPQELTDIPVLMDIGFWCYIPDQDKLKIKLSQTAQTSSGKHNYEGCTNVAIQSNFNMNISASIAKNGAVNGDYSCSVTPNTLSVGGGTVSVCAKLTNAQLGTGGLVGGTKDLRVATVTLKVAPQ
ncbi:MAG TPA: hypothetical protein PLU87_11960 [Sedimentisphaerales bacterium]|nr:hypothetical protein [Sedimentisphaerales bacterium]HRS11752.1 hypothetical protein [Sedimentisphaerales bacterium]HRV48416.1 hypothetical protein [Sedimentisphaerales bacterium]